MAAESAATRYFQGGGQVSVIEDPTWGDNGKGMLVDAAAECFNVVVRYAGGTNAGHTIVHEDEVFKLHGIPSGVFHPGILSVIGTGVAVNPLSLASEITTLQERGVEISPQSLLISRGAHLVMPWHKKRDGLGEVARGGNKIGTTGEGIGPTYSDRSLRVGLRVEDLLDAQHLSEVLDSELAWQENLTRLMAEGPEAGRRNSPEASYYDREQVLADLLAARQILLPFVGSAQEALWFRQDAGERILGEGAQGVLLDPDLGNYPFVTSSHPGVAGFIASTGIHAVERVIGVTKAYATRVGSGPMPTELDDDTGERIRKTGGEFGTTTGRPRRCGWFDAVATRYGARAGGVNTIAVTKLDILDGLPSVKICVGYEVDGVRYDKIATGDAKFWAKAKPVYEELPGWSEPTTDVRRYEDLPANARAYVERLAELVGLPVEIVSVGPHPEETIYRN